MFSKNTRNSLNMFARRTRQLVQAKRRYEQLSTLRTEVIQIVTGEDKVLQKYAHHSRVRSFPRCTLKQKTKEKTCQCNLRTKAPST